MGDKMIETRIIPLECDRVFKAVMGNPKHIRILTKLLSDYLSIPFKELLGNVKLINNELPLENIKNKKKTVDVVVKINDEDIINIEINLSNKESNKIRNFIYLSSLYNTKYNSNEKVYKEKGLTLQINFSNYSINKSQIKETFYIQDSSQNKYLNDFRIDNINIDYCRKICYNKVNKSALEKWCFILTSETLEEMEGSLDGDMEEIKDELKDAVFNVSQDAALLLYYDEDIEKEKIIKGQLEYEKEQSIKEVALNMLKSHINKDLIAKCTHLSINEINKLES